MAGRACSRHYGVIKLHIRPGHARVASHAVGSRINGDVARPHAGRLAAIMAGVAACIGSDLRMIKGDRRPVCGYMAVFASVRRCHMARRRGAGLAGNRPNRRGARAIMARETAPDDSSVFEPGNGPTQRGVTVAIFTDI